MVPRHACSFRRFGPLYARRSIGRRRERDYTGMAAKLNGRGLLHGRDAVMCEDCEATMVRARNNFGSPIALGLFFGTTIAGVALDLWTKWLAMQYLATAAGPSRLIPGWLHFTYVKNQGAVFGMGQGQRAIFIGVSIGAIAFLSYLFALSAGRRFYQFLLGMLLAGVLGNMYDRIVYGYVRDMIYALPGIYWPDAIARWLPRELSDQSVFPWVFNVADSLLCVGVFLMIVYSLFHRPGEKADLQPQTDTEQQHN